MQAETIDMEHALARPVVYDAPAVIPPTASVPVTAQQNATPADLVRFAMQSGADLDRLERLFALQVEWEKREAEKAYNDAFAAFKASPPVIVKDKHVHFEGQKGATDYDHATHFNVTKTIAEALAVHGLSHTWKSTQADGKITVTCTIKHRLGHSESTSMEAGYDQSGGKNAIQAIASAKTYLERHTLLGITGLSTQDVQDDDGAGAGAPPAVTEKVLDGLLADLKLCLTDERAAALWASGSKTLAALGQTEAYAEFKNAVVKHRTALKGRQ